MAKSFGTQLRQEREKRRQTAEMLARACGLSRSYITLIESGRRLPGKKQIPRIAAALKIKTGTVLNWYLEDITCQIRADGV